MKRRSSGLTLIEVLVVLALVAALGVVAAPSFTDSLERARLKSAVDEHVAQLYLAKTEALKKNKPVFISIRDDARCYGFRVGSACDCAQTDPAELDMCSLGRLEVPAGGKALALVSTFATDGTAAFEPVRGTVEGSGRLTWTSPRGYRLVTGLSSVGRVFVCTTGGHGTVPGYQTAGC